MIDPQSPLGMFIVVNAMGLWVLAYILIARRGLKDKSYGMPAIALCANLVWEFLLSFVLPLNQAQHVGNFLTFVPDLVIFYTCFRYGPEDFAHPLLRRWFRPLLLAGLAWAALVEWIIIKDFNDPVASATGLFTNVLLSAMLIAMLLRRQSVRGQSLYIALAILLGNAFAYPVWVFFPAPEPRTPAILQHCCFIAILSLNLVYTVLVHAQSRRDGINPWRRL